MPHVRRLSFNLLSLVMLLGASGCPGSGADAGTDAGPTTDARGGLNDTAPPTTKPLGAACDAAAECSSGFCVDGVCCDAACSDTCYACGEPGAVGICSPVLEGEDLFATLPCSGTKGCFAGGAGAPACKLKDKEPCSNDDVCESGLCRTYFADADRDGHGVTSSALRICDDASASPPVGYAAVAGDCCDSDRRTNSDVPPSSYFSTPNACGSFDWNCDGTVQRQTSTLCPGTGGVSASSVACGASCYVMIPPGPPMKVFTQSCR